MAQMVANIRRVCVCVCTRAISTLARMIIILSSSNARIASQIVPRIDVHDSDTMFDASSLTYSTACASTRYCVQKIGFVSHAI